jgi:hypothetical protein
MKNMKYIIREISILRQFTAMKKFNYTSKLFDVIIPKKDLLKMDCLFMVMELNPFDLTEVLEADYNS